MLLIARLEIKVLEMIIISTVKLENLYRLHKHFVLSASSPSLHCYLMILKRRTSLLCLGCLLATGSSEHGALVTSK